MYLKSHNLKAISSIEMKCPNSTDLHCNVHDTMQFGCFNGAVTAKKKYVKVAKVTKFDNYIFYGSNDMAQQSTYNCDTYRLLRLLTMRRAIYY